MKLLKQGPLLLIILGVGFLLTLAAIGGKGNIYKEQEYHPLEAPLLSIVFTGMNDDIYPWQMFTGLKDEMETMAEVGEGEALEDGNIWMEAEDGTEKESVLALAEESPAKVQKTDEELTAATEPTLAPSPVPLAYGEGRPEPLRESTKEERANHISADIYDDVGTTLAASYEFSQVDESYFDDALFIGDSRTVGLRDYTDLSEHADFYCETSLTIYKVMEENFKDLGTIEEALEENDYGKIYIMIGINELGRGTTEDFMSKYTETIDTLHELEPDAKIVIEGIMRVGSEKDETDKIFNNENINARNNAIATLADNQHIFYIDVNEAVCDEEGNLTADYTFDQIHLLASCYELWKQFLLGHGVG